MRKYKTVKELKQGNIYIDNFNGVSTVSNPNLFKAQMNSQYEKTYIKADPKEIKRLQKTGILHWSFDPNKSIVVFDKKKKEFKIMDEKLFSIFDIDGSVFRKEFEQLSRQFI